jgi:membrane protein YdbS with pleckstrin-like domain
MFLRRSHKVGEVFKMSPNTRLKLCLLIIIVSAMYQVLVAYDTPSASTLVSFYVVLVGTIFILTNVWKKSS